MFAIIKSSGRVIRVERFGKVLFVLQGGRGSISTPRYDSRFELLPNLFTYQEAVSTAIRLGYNL